MQDDVVVDTKQAGPEAERLMHRLMWRQARLSLLVAAIFIAVLVLLPLFNLLAPKLAATPILGFTLTWLLLGVLFYPFTWLLSAFFVKRSDELEDQIAKEEAK